MIDSVKKAKHDVKGLSEMKKQRKLGKMHHGYDVKPSEHEKKLQSKSFSKKQLQEAHVHMKKHGG